MGNNQSRPSDAAVNEKLMERLQALHMKDERPMNEKDGFVVVGGESRTLHGVENGIPSLTVEAPRYTPGVKYQQDVSAASVSEWEKELMEDPKVLHTALILSPTYLCRTASLSQLLAPTLPTPCSHPDPLSSQTPRSSTSRFPSRARPSQTKPHPEDAGSSHRPTFFASLS